MPFANIWNILGSSIESKSLTSVLTHALGYLQDASFSVSHLAGYLQDFDLSVKEF